MNKAHTSQLLFGIALLVATAAPADEIATNRLSFSARFGLNITARFKNVSVAPVSAPARPRTTPPQPGRPDGDPYNYDDGYALTDESGNFGGQTWYWGYDSSASQISGNTILLSRTTAGASASSSPSSFDDDPQVGCELTYNRLLGVAHNARYGVEAAVNYLNLALHANSTFAGSATRVTDAYPFTPGTTPPDTATGPYQGSFEGPGFVIGGTPVSSSATIVPGEAVTDGRQFDADLWGFRLGPYLEVPLGARVNLSFSGGLAGGLLFDNVAWTQTSGNSTLSGHGDDFAVLWGGYVSAVASCRISEHWGLVGGAQYQNLGRYQHTFGGRQVELNLRGSIFLTVGLSCQF